jgi:hypothetical protein
MSSLWNTSNLSNPAWGATARARSGVSLKRAGVFRSRSCGMSDRSGVVRTVGLRAGGTISSSAPLRCWRKASLDRSEPGMLFVLRIGKGWRPKFAEDFTPLYFAQKCRERAIEFLPLGSLPERTTISQSSGSPFVSQQSQFLFSSPPPASMPPWSSSFSTLYLPMVSRRRERVPDDYCEASESTDKRLSRSFDEYCHLALVSA